jgi:hypothetical protein
VTGHPDLANRRHDSTVIVVQKDIRSRTLPLKFVMYCQMRVCGNDDAAFEESILPELRGLDTLGPRIK